MHRTELTLPCTAKGQTRRRLCCLLVKNWVTSPMRLRAGPFLPSKSHWAKLIENYEYLKNNGIQKYFFSFKKQKYSSWYQIIGFFWIMEVWSERCQLVDQYLFEKTNMPDVCWSLWWLALFFQARNYFVRNVDGASIKERFVYFHVWKILFQNSSMLLFSAK